MKRVGNLMPSIVNYKNIELAYRQAKKNKYEKHKKIDFKKFEENYVDNIFEVADLMSLGEFKSSEYSFFQIVDKGKEREIANLPFFPDRIVHWSLMNVTQEIFESTFIETTYASIKGRGVDKALANLNKDLKRYPELKYCLKIDVKKYFPNVDKNILKQLIRRKFKDKRLLKLFDGIIDDYPKSGLPIGNYTSQIFGNFYLTYFDHWIKEEKRVKIYHRYMDDMIFLAKTKKELWELLREIRSYLNKNLKLEVKENYQVFPIESRGVDFVGYKSYGYKITMRNHNKLRMLRTTNKIIKLKKIYGENYYSTKRRRGQLASYNGMLKRSTGFTLKYKTVDRAKLLTERNVAI